LVVVAIKEYSKLKGYWKLIRPPNSITAGVAVVTALILALGDDDDPFNFAIYFTIALTAFCVTAHAMVHNDIVDLEVDKINSPHRPITSEVISLKEAKIFALLLLVIACIAGAISDVMLGLNYPFSLFWAILNIILLDSYNLKFKKSGLFGNLIIAYVVWALFIYADVIIGDSIDITVEAIGIFAFFMNWGREVIKGIRDIDGDRDKGVNTVAVRFGARGGAIIGSFLLFAAIISTIPLIVNPRGSVSIRYILIVFDFVIAYRCIKLVINPIPSYANSTKLLLIYLMLAALLVLLVDQLIRVF